ncbi:MAG: cell wall hydrolase, partial [Proteobacteria bacterium]|nr:cell wall hydrolase [Pseudomonadota bacterium]
MGLTFSGAYLAGGMAQAAVTTAPGFKAPVLGAEATRLDASDTFSTSRVEIGSISEGSQYDGLTSTSLTAPASEDSAAKRQAFGETYNVAEDAGFPAAGGGSRFSMRKSARELDCLTSALYYEARGEGQAGMEAVAQVIVNRARHPDFPKSLCGVIYQGAGRGRGCQFSFACDGSMRRRTEAALWDRARAVAERAMDGQVSSAVGTSTFFHATRISPGWRGLTRVATVGRHVFYRHAGARGSGANFLGGSQVGDFGGVELAVVAEPKAARVYKVASTAPGHERAGRTVRASYQAEPETITPYRVAYGQEDTTAAPDSQPTETLSLDA